MHPQSQPELLLSAAVLQHHACVAWHERDSLRELQFAATCSLTGLWSAASHRLLGVPVPLTSPNILPGAVTQPYASHPNADTAVQYNDEYVVSDRHAAPQNVYAVKRHKSSHVQQSSMTADVHNVLQYQLPDSLLDVPDMPFEEHIMPGSLHHPLRAYKQHTPEARSLFVHQQSFSTLPQHDLFPSAIAAFRKPQTADYAHWHQNDGFLRQDTAHAADAAHTQVQYPAAIDTAAFTAAIVERAETLRRQQPDDTEQPFPGMHSASLQPTQSALHAAVAEVFRDPAAWQAATMRCPLSQAGIDKAVIASDGYVYDEAHIASRLKWYSGSYDVLSPVTDLPLPSTRLSMCSQLQCLINAVQSERQKLTSTCL